jgi:hypothetical protein
MSCRNVANTLGIRPHPVLTHTVQLIGKITGDLDASESGYTEAVRDAVTAKSMQTLRECATENAKDGAVVLLCELTLKLFSAIAEGHQIELKA